RGVVAEGTVRGIRREHHALQRRFARPPLFFVVEEEEGLVLEDRTALRDALLVVAQLRLRRLAGCRIGRQIAVVEPRVRVQRDVLNPGSEVSESSAFRLVSGRLVICAAVRFVAIDGVCVCTTSALSPVTVTFSSSVPTDSTTFTVAGIAAFSVTSLSVAVLNPMSD